MTEYLEIPWFLRKNPDEARKEQMQKFYVHDKSRGFVGNSMLWWRKNHCGYTTNIDDAHEFTEAEARARCVADDLVAYPVERVRAAAESHVTARHALEDCAVPMGT